MNPMTSFFSASGTFGHGLEMQNIVAPEALGGWVSKTVTPSPRAGNPMPRIAETSAGFLTPIVILSVLITNRVGEPEAWVAFDGQVTIADFETDDWVALIDRVAPRYWDLSDPAYGDEIAGWRAAPEMFVSLELVPDKIRSGA